MTAKIVGVYYESVNVSIQRVFDLRDADLIVKEDGQVVAAKTDLIKQSSVQINNIELNISNILNEMGIPAHILGYRYSREAIKMILNGPDLTHAVTKKLYPDVAEVFDTTASKVERAIYHAIEIAWERGNTKLQDEIFKYPNHLSRKKTSNSEFLFRIAREIIIS